MINENENKDEFEYYSGCSSFCHELIRKDLEIEDLHKIIKEKNKEIIELKSIKDNLKFIEKINEPIFNEINKVLKDIYVFFDHYTLKSIDERVKITENNIKHILVVIEKIHKKLEKCIILKPIIEDNEENQKFVEEQKMIQKLKSKYKGEILAFTRKEHKLKLVAHALFEDDLMDLIFDAREKNQITNQDKIFYR